MTDHQDYPLSHRMIKTTTAITVGGSSMVLSSLALAATVMGLVVATPLMLIFSPVLVPAVVAVILITGGFLATGGFCATASYLLYWMYKYVTGKHPVGADNLDHLGQKIGSGVAELKGQAGQQIVKSGQEEQQHHHGQVGEIVQDIEIKGEQERIAAEGADQQPQNKGGQQEEEVEKKQSKSGKKKQQNKGGQDSS